ncbi:MULTISPECIES: SAV_915 family protein [Actinomadura]|uniref:SAV_915 family protein n=1 Tax=Actinomadura yumaensis TaxID=111807 RepID=A0ABW2CT16_9ACTN|nr:SAV_915 family protein [Actinomadura sp. J1-007]MWK37680.1 hypothetical protein [Actinomadura sp. J1-007]
MDGLFIVPVSERGGGALALRTGRVGRERVGIAFSGEDRLRAAYGDGQRWTRLGERALRALLAPLGVTRIQVDPVFVGPEVPVVSAPRRAALAGRR